MKAVMKTVNRLLYFIAIGCFSVINTANVAECMKTVLDADDSKIRVGKFESAFRSAFSDGKPAYLAIGEFRLGRTEEEIGSQPEDRTEYRFGPNNWIFLDENPQYGGEKRVGIKANVNELSVWAEMASKMPETITVVMDDFHLIKDYCTNKLETITQIHKLLKKDGIFIAENPTIPLTGSQLEELLAMFDIYASHNPLACFPYGSGGYGGAYRCLEREIHYIAEHPKMLSRLDATEAEQIGEIHDVMRKLDHERNMDDIAYCKKHMCGGQVSEELKNVWNHGEKIDGLLHTQIIPKYFPWAPAKVINEDARQITAASEFANMNFWEQSRDLKPSILIFKKR
ncbi:hypothetical protein FACS189472_05670 [Alphaproteobacteria bacterium]|nr:hypothetical protein FACS189472_05670 [Alphaproteobacteria bacterium]